MGHHQRLSDLGRRKFSNDWNAFRGAGCEHRDQADVDHFAYTAQRIRSQLYDRSHSDHEYASGSVDARSRFHNDRILPELRRQAAGFLRIDQWRLWWRILRGPDGV